jgi:hypothetical protein
LIQARDDQGLDQGKSSRSSESGQVLDMKVEPLRFYDGFVVIMGVREESSITASP